MATVYVSAGIAGAESSGGGRAPVFYGKVAGETITSSATAASGSLTLPKGGVFKVVCATPVYASADGTASPANGVYVQADVAEYIGGAQGATLSVIDV